MYIRRTLLSSDSKSLLNRGFLDLLGDVSTSKLTRTGWTVCRLSKVFRRTGPNTLRDLMSQLPVTQRPSPPPSLTLCWIRQDRSRRIEPYNMRVVSDINKNSWCSVLRSLLTYPVSVNLLTERSSTSQGSLVPILPKFLYFWYLSVLSTTIEVPSRLPKGSLNSTHLSFHSCMSLITCY